MDKINAILNNDKFREYLSKNIQFEKQRIFCKHGLQHFLNVARIAYIIVLEKNIKVDKETIYAAALLHDIGRWVQYEDNTPHEIASSNLAEQILIECGFTEEEKEKVLRAISRHRGKSQEKETFDEIFYLSDKLSRNCFNCTAIKECKWSEEKKNYLLKY